MHILDDKRWYRNSGFNILESMLALALLASIILSILIFWQNNAANKEARILSNQTEVFAIAFARYMNIESNYIQLLNEAQSAPVTLSPAILGYSWPIDLAMKNVYNQTPCVTVVKNPDTSQLEALMYYVGGVKQNSAQSFNIVRTALSYLGGKGGILLDDQVKNTGSGWQIRPGSLFLSGANFCGGALSNNSLAINMDLLLDWNQSMQPVNSLLLGQDKTLGLLSLPGHLKNANTSKSNLYFTAGNGIVLDNSNAANPTKLSVLYDGMGTGAPTLGIGNTVSAKLVGDTLQPDLFLKVGDVCNPEEAGKTAADQGVVGSINQVLSRSTLVCSQNDLLCGTGNYCYVTSIPNRITFRNTGFGIQDASGTFICPKFVPFAVSLQTGLLSGGQVYVIANTNGTISPNKISAKLDKNGIFNQIINCPISGCNPGIRVDYKSGVVDGLGQLASIDLATVTGDPAGVAVSGGNPGYQIINGAIGSYTTPIGYRVDIGIQACGEVCGNLSQTLGNKWQLLGTNRGLRIGDGVGVDNPELGCACERNDFSGDNADNYNGIAVVIGAGKSIILSATCSNMPIYYKK